MASDQNIAVTDHTSNTTTTSPTQQKEQQQQQQQQKDQQQKDFTLNPTFRQQIKAIIWMRYLLAKRDFRSVFSGIFFPLINIGVALGTSAAFQSGIPTFPKTPLTVPLDLIPKLTAAPPSTDILKVAYIFDNNNANSSINTDNLILWNNSISKYLTQHVTQNIGPSRFILSQYKSQDDLAQSEIDYFRGDYVKEPYFVNGGWRFNSSLETLRVDSVGGIEGRLDYSYTVITESGQDSTAPAVLGSYLDSAEISFLLDQKQQSKSGGAGNSNNGTFGSAFLQPLQVFVTTFVTGISVDIPSQIVPVFMVNSITFLTSFFAESRIRERTLGLSQQVLISGITPFAFTFATFITDFLLYLWTIVTTLILFSICAYSNPSLFRFFKDPCVLGYILPMIFYGPCLVFTGWGLGMNVSKGTDVGTLSGVLQTVVVFIPYFFLQLVYKNQISKPLIYITSFLLPPFGLTRVFLSTAQSVQTPTPLTLSQVFDLNGSDVIPVCLMLILNGVCWGLWIARRGGIGSESKSGGFSLWEIFGRFGSGSGNKSGDDIEMSDGMGGNDTDGFLVDSELETEVQRLKNSVCEDGKLWDGDETVRVEGLGKVIDVDEKGVGRRWNSKKGKLVVLKDLWFGVRSGECFGFLGPNGAGKSTTIKILTGLETSTSGNYHLPSLSQSSKPSIGLCPQQNALFDKLTSREHIRIYAMIRGVAYVSGDVRDYVEKCLDEVAIEKGDRDVLSERLSGGNRRRLMMAVAAVGRPRVLLFDEPTTGVDVAVRRSIWTAVQSFKKTSSIILTTHSMEEADTLSTKIGILINGKLRCLGTPQRLKTVYGTGYIVTIRMTDFIYADKMVKWFSSMMQVKHSRDEKDYQLSVNLSSKIGCVVVFEVRRVSADEDSAEVDGDKVYDELVVLEKVYKVLEGRHSDNGDVDEDVRNGIVEFAVSQASLKQVFVGFAKKQKQVII
ncbi:ATP-binding cassette sub- A member 2 [Blyttiomyces sp. JEL0837]|nr:ATP-binding cassette sub- A member 2 [Blyttiomyces sp. JEL0837]